MSVRVLENQNLVSHGGWVGWGGWAAAISKDSTVVWERGEGNKEAEGSR